MIRSFGKHLIYILLLVIVVGVFWVEALYVEDQDFGWHLRVGEIILTQGVPATDPFSYTMQDFPWVDHSWLTDVSIAWLYHRIGIPGLAFVFALIVVGAIQIAVSRVSLPSLREAPPAAGRRSNLIHRHKSSRARSGIHEIAALPAVARDDVRVHELLKRVFPQGRLPQHQKALRFSAGMNGRRRAFSAGFRLRQKLWTLDCGGSLGDFAVFPYILAFAALLPFFRIRTQVVSWLLFSVLVWILFSGKRWRILRWMLPILFIVWANIHASFVGGLAAVVIVLALRYWRKKNIDWIDGLVVVLGVGATLINPYGVGMWREVVMTLFNPLAQGQVDEWRSVLTMSELNVAMVLFGVSSVVLVWRARKEFLLEEHGLYWLLFLQAVMTKRLLPLWIIIALPLTYRAIRSFHGEAAQLPYGHARFRKAYVFLWVTSIVLFIMQAVLFSGVIPTPNALQVPYPAQAIAYLRGNLPEGNIFSLYGWGGYLIRQLPEKKTFIDGRMAHWYWLPTSDKNLPSVLDLYLNIVSGTVPYAGAFDQFDVDTVLWPAPREQYLIEKIGQYTDQYLFRQQEQQYSFLDNLEQDGWQLMYEDSAAVIYQRHMEETKKLRN